MSDVRAQHNDNNVKGVIDHAGAWKVNCLQDIVVTRKSCCAGRTD